MFYRTFGVVCDECEEEFELQGGRATHAEVVRTACRSGWSIHGTTHLCPEHRAASDSG